LSPSATAAPTIEEAKHTELIAVREDPADLVSERDGLLLSLARSSLLLNSPYLVAVKTSLVMAMFRGNKSSC
jgi:hypothetical protein